MVLGEAIRTTFAEIWAHKLRSALTLVGVVLGSMAVVFMVSLIEAVKVEVWHGISELGLTGVMFISSSEPQTPLDAQRAHLSDGLRQEDAAHLPVAAERIAAAAPMAFTERMVAWGGRQQSAPVMGTTPTYRQVFERKMAQGRYLSDIDLQRKRRVVVLGHDLAEELFGSHDPLGEWVRMGDNRFEVIGIGEDFDNPFVNDGFIRRELRTAVVPLSTYQALLVTEERLPVLAVKATSTEGLRGLAAHLRNLLWRRHNRVEDFEVENVAAEILEAEEQIHEQLRGWTLVLFAISAISLVVGGVGIFSVLQISLAERLYEIGLRKSIGAEDRDILVQFLTEAVFLSVLGAGIGLTIAVGLCASLGRFFQAGVPVSWFALVLAMLFAVGIGLVAGLYPSLRAARLTPVEALRG